MTTGRVQASSWQSAVADWVNKRGAGEVSADVVAFFDRAFETPRRLYPQDAWFGIHAGCISLTIGNMWLAAVTGSSKRVMLITEPDVRIRGMELSLIPSTLRYTPLGFTTVKPLERVVAMNKNQRAWDSYARACELILESPISRNVITRNLHRKVKVGELN